MRRFTSNIVGTSLIALALSVLAVGVVWAGSSAMQVFVDDPTDTTVPTEGEVPELGPGDALSPEELTAMVHDLTLTVQQLQEQVDAYEADIVSARDAATKSTAAAVAAQATAETASTVAQEAKSQVTAVVKRTSKLTEDGVYTGTVTPGQLSRKLTATDLNGDWPLDRTTGELGGEKIKVSGSSCWTDYRYNILVTPDTFRGLTCLKILK